VTIEKADLAVIGAGPAGLAAAEEIARLGGQVVVLDEAPVPGGRLPSQIHPKAKMLFFIRPQWSNGSKRAELLYQKASEAGAKIFCGLSVWGVLPGWFVGTSPADPSLQRRDIPAGFEARAVLLATGAVQKPLPMPGWTLPGVITAGAAQTLINVHRVLPGRRVVVIGIEPLALSTAYLMAVVGIHVLGVVLPPSNHFIDAPVTPEKALENLGAAVSPGFFKSFDRTGKIMAFVSALAAKVYPVHGVKFGGFPLMPLRAAQVIAQRPLGKEVEIVSLAPNGMIRPNSAERWQVDAVVTSAGLHPLVELAQTAGCPLAYVDDLGGWVPVHSPEMETPLPGLFVAGSITGIEGSEVAEAQGRLAARTIAGCLGFFKQGSLEYKLGSAHKEVEAARAQAFPFMPRLRRGRRIMSHLWAKHRDHFPDHSSPHFLFNSRKARASGENPDSSGLSEL
jgi:sarcosine oxidase, subunit alpha